MRLSFLAAAAALLLSVGATGANALTLNDGTSTKLSASHCQRLRPSYGATAAWTMLEARAVDSRAGYWGARQDDVYRRPTDNGYHDPRFSLQQDEIYNGRF